MERMSDLLDDSAKRASRYLESLNTRSVAPAKEAVDAPLPGSIRPFQSIRLPLRRCSPN
jgi:hypothetical protein